MDALLSGHANVADGLPARANGQKAGAVKALVTVEKVEKAENADDLRCAQWVIERGSAVRWTKR